MHVALFIVKMYVDYYVDSSQVNRPVFDFRMIAGNTLHGVPI